MKKTLVLASLLAAFGAASAQTSVTVGGTTSFGYQRVAGTSSLQETDMTVTFKGTEQLGGGLSAAFFLEFDNSSASFRQLNTYATGVTATTSSNDRQGVRRKNTTLSLAGGFGTVTLANTRGGEAASTALVAPTNLDQDFWSTGVLTRPNVDSLGYSLPMGPLTLGIGYSESGVGEGAGDNSTAGTNQTVTLSARYASGPLSLAAAYKNTDGPSASVRAGNYEFGAKLDLGAVVIGAGFDSKPINGRVVGSVTGNNDKMALAFGVSVPMGASTAGLNYAKRGEASFVELGFQHNLSARTNVNLSVGRFNVIDQTVANGLKTGTTGQYRVSLNHAF